MAGSIYDFTGTEDVVLYFGTYLERIFVGVVVVNGGSGTGITVIFIVERLFPIVFYGGIAIVL